MPFTERPAQEAGRITPDEMVKCSEVIFAEPKQLTYVELLFESGGHEYKIWRSPAYERSGYKSMKQAEVRWMEDGQGDRAESGRY